MSHPSSGALIERHFGEAPPQEEAEVRRHLSACTECRAFVNELADLERALLPGPDDAPPEDGLDRVLARVGGIGAGARRMPDWVMAAVPSGLALGAGVWAIRTTAERLATLGLVPGPTSGWSPEILGLSLAALGIVGLGAVVTLALAPVLILESHGRS